MITQVCEYEVAKGGLISDFFFTLAKISKKELQNPSPLRLLVLRRVIWHLFLESKNFLRLSTFTTSELVLPPLHLTLLRLILQDPYLKATLK